MNMIRRQSGLGRGLGALIPQRPLETTDMNVRVASPAPPSENLVKQLSVDVIDPNPHQPRQHFDHGDLEDLVGSIKMHGVIQPIVVTQNPGGRYELIAGERRLRAAKIAGLEQIPAIIRSATEQEKMELALIENVQRADLNPIEEARAYQRLCDEFGLTQDEVGERMNKSRPQVSNTIRLLQLPEVVQRALAERKISQSNARTLLSLPTPEERLRMFESILAGNFTVRQTEDRTAHPRRVKHADPNLIDLENRLRDSLGTKVLIKRDSRGEGEIKIKFYDDGGLQEIVNKIFSS